MGPAADNLQSFSHRSTNAPPLLHAGGILAKVMRVLRFGVASAWPRFGQLCQSLPAKREVSNDTSADDQAIAEPLR